MFSREFWNRRMRDRKVFVYFFAPLFDEVASMLNAASKTWHSWSLSRRGELFKISVALKERASTIRQSGLGWAGSAPEWGNDHPGHLLAYSGYHRSFPDSENIVCPEATLLLIKVAIDTLFLLESAFKKIEKIAYEETGHVKFIYQAIEPLMEFPGIQNVLEIPKNLVKQAIPKHGFLLECETLAYLQATIEGRYVNLNPKLKKKRKCDHTDAELQDLAFEFNTSFDTMREIFETAPSEWCGVRKKYEEEAEDQRKVFVNSLPADEKTKEVVCGVWLPGDCYMSWPDYVTGGEVSNCERLVQALMSLFLEFSKSEAPEFSAPAELPEHT